MKCGLSKVPLGQRTSRCCRLASVERALARGVRNCHLELIFSDRVSDLSGDPRLPGAVLSRDRSPEEWRGELPPAASPPGPATRCAHQEITTVPNLMELDSA